MLTHLCATLSNDERRKHAQSDAALRENLALRSFNSGSGRQFVGHVPRPGRELLLDCRAGTQNISILDPVVRDLPLRPLHEASHEHDVVGGLDLKKRKLNDDDARHVSSEFKPACGVEERSNPVEASVERTPIPPASSRVFSPRDSPF